MVHRGFHVVHPVLLFGKCCPTGSYRVCSMTLARVIRVLLLGWRDEGASLYSSESVFCLTLPVTNLCRGRLGQMTPHIIWICSANHCFDRSRGCSDGIGNGQTYGTGLGATNARLLQFCFLFFLEPDESCDTCSDSAASNE